MAVKPHQAPTGKRARGDDRPRQRILYVEDEDLNWEIAHKRLIEKYDLVRACNSREAFDLLRTGTFDLILMDIQLSNSEYDGIAITQILSDRFKGNVPATAKGLSAKKLPIVFVTAYTARYSKDELRSYGAEDLIAKPIDFIQLTLAMSRLIARRQLG